LLALRPRHAPAGPPTPGAAEGAPASAAATSRRMVPFRSRARPPTASPWAARAGWRAHGGKDSFSLSQMSAQASLPWLQMPAVSFPIPMPSGSASPIPSGFVGPVQLWLSKVLSLRKARLERFGPISMVQLEFVAAGRAHEQHQQEVPVADVRPLLQWYDVVWYVALPAQQLWAGIEVTSHVEREATRRDGWERSARPELLLWAKNCPVRSKVRQLKHGEALTLQQSLLRFQAKMINEQRELDAPSPIIHEHDIFVVV